MASRCFLTLPFRRDNMVLFEAAEPTRENGLVASMEPALEARVFYIERVYIVGFLIRGANNAARVLDRLDSPGVEAASAPILHFVLVLGLTFGCVQ